MNFRAKAFKSQQQYQLYYFTSNTFHSNRVLADINSYKSLMKFLFKGCHSSLANLSIQLFQALYKYYPIKLLAEHRQFNKMMGIIIHGEVWNTTKVADIEMSKKKFFFLKKSQIHNFFYVFWQFW